VLALSMTMPNVASYFRNCGILSSDRQGGFPRIWKQPTEAAYAHHESTAIRTKGRFAFGVKNSIVPFSFAWSDVLRVASHTGTRFFSSVFAVMPREICNSIYMCSHRVALVINLLSLQR